MFNSTFTNKSEHSSEQRSNLVKIEIGLSLSRTALFFIISTVCPLIPKIEKITVRIDDYLVKFNTRFIIRLKDSDGRRPPA